MPPLPPAHGVAKIIVKQTLGGTNIFNVLHAASSPAINWTTAECQSMANAVRAAWVSNVIPLQTTALTLTDVQVVDIGSATGNEATATGSTPGTVVAVALPASAAICWSWKIGRRYRGGHPRTYIGGLTGTDLLNPNTIAVARVTAHAAAAAAIRSAINGVMVGGNVANMCCVNYVRNKVPLDPPETDFFTGVSVDSRVDTQRRRLGRDR